MISGKTKIQKIDCDENKRMIAISDIHGEVTYLDGVLKKANYSTDDILIIVGDLIEKGRESLKTVRYILDLKEQNPNVYVTMGNVDLYRFCVFLDDSPEGNEEFIGSLYWTKDVWKRGFFLDILDEMGIVLEDVNADNIMEIKMRIKEQYQKELDFIWNLPTMIFMGNFIFVHGGVYSDKPEEITETEPFVYLKLDDFMNKEVRFDKTVVVGHWPACLYRNDIICMNPLFDDKKHIIGIDGGCALKKNGGQLNALLIPNAYASMEDCSFVAYDDYPIIVAQKSQRAKEGTIRITYFDCEVELLEEKDGIAKVRHISSGKEFDAMQSDLYRRDGKLFCDDYSDALLEVAEGDKLSVLEENAMGIYAKKDGVVGWYKETNH
uniref:metallophosphoesterase n=1 Tax=Acetatifactor sp. TaxID=1872090 RepID=UPI004055AC44